MRGDEGGGSEGGREKSSAVWMEGERYSAYMHVAWTITYDLL